MMELRVVAVALPPALVARLAAIAPKLADLAEVVRWGLAQTPTCEVVDVVVQDEYTHDVIVRGPPPAYLCFDTT